LTATTARSLIRAIPPQVAADIAMMMNKVVEEGTAKRAMLDDIKAAGEAGTTNPYRDAWFVGYTGNFLWGVWYGNDDHSPLNRMKRLAAGTNLTRNHGLCASGHRAQTDCRRRTQIRRR
jgi:membrane peptidoglycan carboxypeptidase